jgi:hypothetical protein
VIQPDGSIIIGGEFRAGMGRINLGLARLYSDGTLDTTFSKVIVGGYFGPVNGFSRSGILRLNPDGSELGFASSNYVVSESGGSANVRNHHG